MISPSWFYSLYLWRWEKSDKNHSLFWNKHSCYHSSFWVSTVWRFVSLFFPCYLLLFCLSFFRFYTSVNAMNLFRQVKAWKKYVKIRSLKTMLLLLLLRKINNMFKKLAFYWRLIMLPSLKLFAYRYLVLNCSNKLANNLCVSHISFFILHLPASLHAPEITSSNYLKGTLLVCSNVWYNLGTTNPHLKYHHNNGV